MLMALSCNLTLGQVAYAVGAEPTDAPTENLNMEKL